MNRPRLTRTRMIAGAIGGIVGTVAMTAAMRRLSQILPVRERYPLPPREITEQLLPAHDEAANDNRTLLAHAGFGAAAGALMTAAFRPQPARGSLLGVAVWTFSYFGWVPLSGTLKPANRHPVERNALMVVVHLIWGSVTAMAARELLVAQRSVFAAGPLLDAAREAAAANPTSE